MSGFLQYGHIYVHVLRVLIEKGDYYFAHLQIHVANNYVFLCTVPNMQCMNVCLNCSLLTAYFYKCVHTSNEVQCNFNYLYLDR